MGGTYIQQRETFPAIIFNTRFFAGLATFPYNAAWVSFVFDRKEGILRIYGPKPAGRPGRVRRLAEVIKGILETQGYFGNITFQAMPMSPEKAAWQNGFAAIIAMAGSLRDHVGLAPSGIYEAFPPWMHTTQISSPTL
ncbi:hypothetical protein IL306_009663 [Fusarium sp. DS 682]|nr:hypothetical protein IL306_009663 [Fusarium sp. DS 682]